jgi:hypothetical protein
MTFWESVMVSGVVLVALLIAFLLLKWLIRGAGDMFEWAGKEGALPVIGMVIFWVCAFPVMAMVSIVWGALFAKKSA